MGDKGDCAQTEISGDVLLKAIRTGTDTVRNSSLDMIPNICISGWSETVSFAKLDSVGSTYTNNCISTTVSPFPNTVSRNQFLKNLNNCGGRLDVRVCEDNVRDLYYRERK